MRAIWQLWSVAAVLAVVFGCSQHQPATPEDQARALLAQRQFDAAIELCDTAIALAPKNVDLWIVRGQAYQQKKDFDRALADFEKAKELDPTNPDPLYHCANVYKERGDMEKYVECTRQAHLLDPNYEIAHSNEFLTPLTINTPPSTPSESGTATNDVPLLPEAQAGIGSELGAFGASDESQVETTPLAAPAEQDTQTAGPLSPVKTTPPKSSEPLLGAALQRGNLYERWLASVKREGGKPPADGEAPLEEEAMPGLLEDDEPNGGAAQELGDNDLPQPPQVRWNYAADGTPLILFDRRSQPISTGIRSSGEDARGNDAARRGRFFLQPGPAFDQSAADAGTAVRLPRAPSTGIRSNAAKTKPPAPNWNGLTRPNQNPLFPPLNTNNQATPTYLPRPTRPTTGVRSPTLDQ